MKETQIISATLLLSEFSGHYSPLKIARIIRSNRSKEQKQFDRKNKRNLNYYAAIIYHLTKEL